MEVAEEFGELLFGVHSNRGLDERVDA